MDDTKSDRPFHGILFACLAFGLFATMTMLGKLVADQHNAIEVSFYRNLVSIAPYVLYILFAQRHDLLKTQKPRLLAFRCFIGTIGLFATIAATQILPLAYATVLFFVSTLIIPIIAHFFLGETIGRHRITAIIIGMSGVLLVVQPSGAISIWGAAIALFAGITHAIIQACLRELRSENSTTVIFYFFLTALLGSAIFMPFVATVPTLQSLLIMGGVGVAGLLAHICLTKAFQCAQASLISPFNYTGLLWATGFDVLIWQAWPELSVWAGAALIIVASLYITYREYQRTQSAA